MKRIIIGLVVALVAWAAYLLSGLAYPTPKPVVTTPPNEAPYTPVCPTITHAAQSPHRGEPCPEITTTTTVGGEST